MNFKSFIKKKDACFFYCEKTALEDSLLVEA